MQTKFFRSFQHYITAWARLDTGWASLGWFLVDMGSCSSQCPYKLWGWLKSPVSFLWVKRSERRTHPLPPHNAEDKQSHGFTSSPSHSPLITGAILSYTFRLNAVNRSVPMAARSKAQVRDFSPAELVGLNPARDMDVCAMWVLCVVR